ncbi:MAG: amino acid permease [Luteitalea sp.]|nr:amino acid permease [Luteitalea sp.]
MTLTRVLREWDVTLLFIGAVIGSGIFIVPATVLRQVDQAFGLALLVWVAGGVLSLLGALTYAELGAQRPDAGGLYVYIRDAFGAFPAFLYGWTLFFVISASSTATLAVAFAAYVGTIVPLSAVAATSVSIGMIAAVTAVNVWGTRQSATLQNWTTAAKWCGVLVMGAALIAYGPERAEIGLQLWPTHATGLLAGVGGSIIGVLWAYEGWQYCTFSAGETINPQRALPRAFLLGSVGLIVVYVVANIGYVATLGVDRAAASDSIAAAAVETTAGPAVARLVTVMILVSMASAANATVLTAPRVYYAMARDGLFFKQLAHVHPRFGTPAVAVIAGSAWSAMLAATGTFEQLLTVNVFAGWLFYGLAAASIFVYRRRQLSGSASFRVPGYPITPLLFVVASAAVVLSTIASEPGRVAMGAGVVLLGAPAYMVWRIRRAPQPGPSVP